MKKSISVVTPVFNEEETVRDCVDAIRKVFDEHLPEYLREHLFCDNASTDRTLEILKEIAAEDPCVKIIVNARNFGPMRSDFNGIVNASGDAVLLLMPADLQDPPELLPEFVRLWEQGNEIVYGIRAEREEPLPMLLVRKLYYRVMSRISNFDMPPDVGDFQLVDRKVVEIFKTYDDHYPFVRAMTFECGFKSQGIPYTWKARQKGISKNRLYHLVDQGLNGLISFSSVPMRMALLFGTILATLAIGYAIFNTIFWFTSYGDAVPRGTTLLITALFFFAGVQLFFIGFLGEYVLAIYGQVRRRPMVVERERVNFDDPRPPARRKARKRSPPRK